MCPAHVLWSSSKHHAAISPLCPLIHSVFTKSLPSARWPAPGEGQLVGTKHTRSRLSRSSHAVPSPDPLLPSLEAGEDSRFVRGSPRHRRGIGAEIQHQVMATGGVQGTGSLVFCGEEEPGFSKGSSSFKAQPKAKQASRKPSAGSEEWRTGV